MEILNKLLLAALAGGVICAVSQFFIDKTKVTPAKILVCILVLGVFVGALGLYEPLLKIFGCGVSVPLFGFGGNIATGVREAIEKDGIKGLFSGPVSAMSAGVTVALLCGYVASLLCHGKSKKM